MRLPTNFPLKKKKKDHIWTEAREMKLQLHRTVIQQCIIKVIIEAALTHTIWVLASAHEHQTTQCQITSQGEGKPGLFLH